MPEVRTIYVEGREVKFKLAEPTLELKGILENTIGKAKRSADKQPGTAMFVVMRQMLDNLWVDGEEIQWKKKGFDRIPLIYDDDGTDLFDRLIGEILSNKHAKRLLLSKPEYREVFEEYLLPEDVEVDDLDPTGFQISQPG